jgi:hypothetical protein
MTLTSRANAAQEERVGDVHRGRVHDHDASEVEITTQHAHGVAEDLQRRRA